MPNDSIAFNGNRTANKWIRIDVRFAISKGMQACS
jgi:hypothetical protein